MKHIITFFFALFFAFSFAHAQTDPNGTECEAIVVTSDNPFFESFEGADFGCWQNFGDYWVISDRVPQGQTEGGGNVSLRPQDGSQVALFSVEAYDMEAMIVSPTLDLSALTNPTLSFYMTKLAWGEDVNDFQVGYSLNEDITQGWTTLLFDEESYPQWTRFSFRLPDSLNTTVRIGFAARNQFGHPVGIDSVFIYDSIPPAAPDTIEPTDTVSIADAQCSSFTIFPNPAHDLLNVQSTHYQQLEILNLVGQVILRQNITAENTSVNISELPAGVYLLQMKGKDNVVAVKKFTKN